MNNNRKLQFRKDEVLSECGYMAEYYGGQEARELVSGYIRSHFCESAEWWVEHMKYPIIWWIRKAVEDGHGKAEEEAVAVPVAVSGGAAPT